MLIIKFGLSDFSLILFFFFFNNVKLRFYFSLRDCDCVNINDKENQIYLSPEQNNVITIVNRDINFNNSRANIKNEIKNKEEEDIKMEENEDGSEIKYANIESVENSGNKNEIQVSEKNDKKR